MEYALLIYVRPDVNETLGEDEVLANRQEYFALLEDERITSGAGLEGVETATTVRSAGGTTLTTDGPFAETREVFAGFYLVDAPDLDSALELAGRVPAIRLEGAVEVRPISRTTS